MINSIYERLQIISYTIYESSSSTFTVWKDETKNTKLYTIEIVARATPDENSKLEIRDGNGVLLADNMTPDKVMEFIEEDMNIGSPIPNSEIVYAGRPKINTVYVDSNVESETIGIIKKAAAKHGTDPTSLLKMIHNKKIDTGTVKKKRTISIDDLE